MQNENESEIYINPEEEHLMIIPGFDGNYQTMNHVSERLNILAATLQLEPDFDQSITEIANRLMNVRLIIKVRIHLKSKFYILGYSFGVNVALELAALLEKEGKTGVVFCLDSSPDALKIQLNAYLGPMTDQELQNSLIEHIYNLLTGQTSTELTTKLEGVVDWSEKINLCIDIVKNSVTYTHEFLRSLVHVSYRRVVMAKEYEPRMKLESELVLMKGIPHPKAKKLSDDYGLSKYSTKPIKVFDLKADHVNALQDCRISNIVNKMLEPGLLEEFKKKNLCKYYFA
ncbi:Uncharacterized protein OBRU01_18095 [Operophtera brumata]|uniref:Oleoyl-[acyl-carrier-protein] hydrolase n=1 Tax=Operophtera brumata TaxID=104452 RepID=A0A0L7L080_OPEBR|nr:Uncharacterized protein OBRU01_18095 [Operophtera brumata]